MGVRGATLQHRVVPASLGWYDQVGAACSLLLCSDAPFQCSSQLLIADLLCQSANRVLAV